MTPYFVKAQVIYQRDQSQIDIHYRTPHSQYVFSDIVLIEDVPSNKFAQALKQQVLKQIKDILTTDKLFQHIDDIKYETVNKL